jgi:hypothetical protein
MQAIPMSGFPMHLPRKTSFPKPFMPDGFANTMKSNWGHANSSVAIFPRLSGSGISSRAYEFPTRVGPEKKGNYLIPGVISGYLAAAISTRGWIVAEA